MSKVMNVVRISRKKERKKERKNIIHFMFYMNDHNMVKKILDRHQIVSYYLYFLKLYFIVSK